MNDIKSFTLFREFMKGINVVKPIEKRDKFLGQIVDYYFKDIELKLDKDSDEEAIWENIGKPIKEYKKNAINGSKGGRPKITQTETQNITQTESTIKDVIVNVNVNSNKFTKPNIEDIKEYCNNRSNNINAESFYDFYESKGWKVGNQSMKDWKACIRTWEKRNDVKKEKVPDWFDKEIKAEPLTPEDEDEFRNTLGVR